MTIVVVMIMIATFAMFMMMVIVLMTFRSMRVAMRLFFFRRIADFENFDIKMKRLTCKRMIAVNLHLLASNSADREDHSGTVWTTSFKLHPRLDFNVRRKLAALHRQLKILVDLPVTFRGVNFH